MKVLRYLSIVLALAALTACNDLLVPDLNNPGLDQLSESPTRSSVVAATQGLFISARVGMAGRAGYVSALGIIGRESYNFDGSDPGFSTEMLVGPLDGGSPAFGGALWTPRYRAIRGAANVLLAVAAVSDADLAAAEKAGIRGIANTLMGLQLLLVLNTRDTNGIPTTVNPDPTGDPTPFKTKSQAFTDIVAILESAATDLGRRAPRLRQTWASPRATLLPTPIPDQASLGISSDLMFAHYGSPTASLPIIRNEELILLRAEANLGAGNAAAALTDINLVRTTSGGLDAIGAAAWAAMTATQRLDELLYNKRYSLLWEGGHRWIDMRRYGKLGEIPLDLPSFTIPSAYPVPTQECDQRTGNPPPSC